MAAADFVPVGMPESRWSAIIVATSKVTGTPTDETLSWKTTVQPPGRHPALGSTLWTAPQTSVPRYVTLHTPSGEGNRPAKRTKAPLGPLFLESPQRTLVLGCVTASRVERLKLNPYSQDNLCSRIRVCCVVHRERCDHRHRNQPLSDHRLTPLSHRSTVTMRQLLLHLIRLSWSSYATATRRRYLQRAGRRQRHQSPPQ